MGTQVDFGRLFRFEIPTHVMYKAVNPQLINPTSCMKENPADNTRADHGLVTVICEVLAKRQTKRNYVAIKRGI